MSTKSANVTIRMEPEVKKQAETILNALGISSSMAITLFYKQIILHHGLPFDVVIPETASHNEAGPTFNNEEEETFSVL